MAWPQACLGGGRGSRAKRPEVAAKVTVLLPLLLTDKVASRASSRPAPVVRGPARASSPSRSGAGAKRYSSGSFRTAYNLLGFEKRKSRVARPILHTMQIETGSFIGLQVTLQACFSNLKLQLSKLKL